jgi:phosphatidylinositol glycan class V
VRTATCPTAFNINTQADIAGNTETTVQHYVVAGIVISNVCHLLSVLVLCRLLTIILGPRQRHQLPFISSVLHVFTPASLFLSAPYTEALFSLLNLTGMFYYAQSRFAAQSKSAGLQEDIYKLSSGLFFGVATLMRSNGLLSGLILLWDVARYLPRIISMRLTVHDMRRIIVTCASGVLVALGFVGPQALAYTEFCSQNTNSQPPLWCSKRIPSIYSWVQDHYW